MTYESIRDSIRRPFEYLGLLALKHDEPNNLGIGAAYTVDEAGAIVAAHPAPGSPRYLEKHPEQVYVYTRDGEPVPGPTGRLAEIATRITAKLG